VLRRLYGAPRAHFRSGTYRGATATLS
jgi:hypothetical protein